MKVTAIVMAGGGGTRLWPISTQETPKQFCRILGNKTMLESTLDRLSFLGKENIYISSVRQLEKNFASIQGYPVMYEPFSMDTAPSIAFSLISLDASDDDVLAFVPSDHYVDKSDSFKNDFLKAVSFFEKQDGMLLVGIVPTFPAQCYGYIQTGKPLTGGFFKVDRFHEKPDAVAAARYIEQGNVYWNSGMFFFRSSFVKNAFQTHAPELYDGVKQVVALLKSGRREEGEQRYRELQKISFDYAVVEHIQDSIYAMPNSFVWSDVGSWDNFYHLQAGGAKHSFEKGNVKTFKTHNVLCINESPQKIVLNGVKDLFVIASEDNIYIEARENSEALKDVLKKI